MTKETKMVVKPPKGTKLRCKSWQTEAPLRMMMHNLSPEVAEDPDNLIIYGGRGKAARNWDAYQGIVKALEQLEKDETLLVQSGKAVGIFKTHEEAPRVLIANSNLVPRWSTWEVFDELDRKGLMMYGQMTAGSWIYIGTQGILQGTYETLAAVAKQKFGGSLEGKLVLTAGLGGMGGAQPLAVTMNKGVAIVVEVDPKRAERRLNTRYLDTIAESIDDAIEKAEQAKRDKKPLSIGLIGNAADIFPYIAKNGPLPDVVTDQTSAHDPVGAYIPSGYSVESAAELRERDPDNYLEESRASMVKHCEAMVDMLDQGSIVFDYGNNLRGEAQSGGFKDAFKYPGFVPAYIRPLFCEGKGPFRWVALSGDPNDIYVTDDLLLEMFPDDEPLCRWCNMAREQVSFQGLPSRICWLGYGDRAKFGLAVNEAIASGRISAPIVFGRDHLDTGSVASPYRETEGMKDGSDAVADWPLLNALLNTASGATWVSIHNGGGVGIGLSTHAGQVTLADGSKEAARRIERVFTNDPGMGIVRHADAGYEDAIKVAKVKNVKIPGLTC